MDKLNRKSLLDLYDKNNNNEPKGISLDSYNKQIQDLAQQPYNETRSIDKERISDFDKYENMKTGLDITESLLNMGIVGRELLRKPSKGFNNVNLMTTEIPFTTERERKDLGNYLASSRANTRRLINEAGLNSNVLLGTQANELQATNKGLNDIANREMQIRIANEQARTETVNKETLMNSEIQAKNIQKQQQENAMSGQIISGATSSALSSLKGMIQRKSLLSTLQDPTKQKDLQNLMFIENIAKIGE